jgi:lysozyme
MQDKTNSVLGIDISHYNQVTDWQAVKNYGVNFIYCKATEGTGYVDPTFDTNHKGAIAMGIPFGAYHFARPANDPTAEAKHFLSVINQYSLDLIPVLDLEITANGVDLVQWVRTFIQTMGQPVILYTGNWFIDEAGLTGLNDIPLWTSYYKETPPPDCGGWTNWTMWQYTESGNVNGIQGNVDLDVAVSLEAISKPIVNASPSMEPWLQKALIQSIQELGNKGNINNPDLWINKINKGQDISALSILLINRMVK